MKDPGAGTTAVKLSARSAKCTLAVGALPRLRVACHSNGGQGRAILSVSLAPSPGWEIQNDLLQTYGAVLCKAKKRQYENGYGTVIRPGTVPSHSAKSPYGSVTKSAERVDRCAQTRAMGRARKRTKKQRGLEPSPHGMEGNLQYSTV